MYARSAQSGSDSSLTNDSFFPFHHSSQEWALMVYFHTICSHEDRTDNNIRITSVLPILIRTFKKDDKGVLVCPDDTPESPHGSLISSGCLPIKPNIASFPTFSSLCAENVCAGAQKNQGFTLLRGRTWTHHKSCKEVNGSY
jgi:hypothetical protein